MSGCSIPPLGIEMAGKRDDGILANFKDSIIFIATYDQRNVSKEASSDATFSLWQGWELDGLATVQV